MKRNTILALSAGIAIAAAATLAASASTVNHTKSTETTAPIDANFEGVWPGSPMSADPYEGSRTNGMVVHLRAEADGGPNGLGKPEFSLKLAGGGTMLGKPQIGPQTATQLLGALPEETQIVVAEGWNIHASLGGTGGIYPDTTEGDAHPGGGALTVKESGS